MIEEIESFLHHHFSNIAHHSPYRIEILHEFLKLGPLKSFIPKTLGGHDSQSGTYLSTVEATSYYSLPLGLTLGIAGSLFLLPMIKHGTPEVRDIVIQDFIDKPVLGGMMITEPGGGTDIFSLQSYYCQDETKLSLNGTKCWGGLTGLAEHWLVAARLKKGDQLSKKLNLIYVPFRSKGVCVQEEFDALGLQPIPYGMTRYDQVTVPNSHVLGSTKGGGLRVIYDTLFRSRLGMPAISAGHCRRLAHEVSLRIHDRQVLGRPLADYDQVRFRLEDLQAMATLNQQLCRFNAIWMREHEDISTDYTLVNACKLVCSETIQAASDSAMQIFASAAFKRNHLVGRAYVDSRPFPIFEGSNDVLDDNLYDTIVGRQGVFTLEAINQELSQYGLCLSPDLPAVVWQAFDQARNTPQRKKVVLGRTLAWAVAEAILNWGQETSTPPTPVQAYARRLTHRKMVSLIASLDYLS